MFRVNPLKGAAERGQKAILRQMLPDRWRRFSTLRDAINADDQTTVRLLLEIGARPGGADIWTLDPLSVRLRIRVPRDPGHQSKTLYETLRRWEETKRYWEQNFTPETYYRYLREEVKREDDITNQRIIWSLQFQGFLIASMSFLLGGTWSAGIPNNVLWLRWLLALGIGVVGLLVALRARAGVKSSRIAIAEVKDYWNDYINSGFDIIPTLVPKAFAQSEIDKSYSVRITQILVWSWLVFDLFYLSYLLFFGAIMHAGRDELPLSVLNGVRL